MNSLPSAPLNTLIENCDYRLALQWWMEVELIVVDTVVTIWLMGLLCGMSSAHKERRNPGMMVYLDDAEQSAVSRGASRGLGRVPLWCPFLRTACELSSLPRATRGPRSSAEDPSSALCCGQLSAGAVWQHVSCARLRLAMKTSAHVQRHVHHWAQVWPRK